MSIDRSKAARALGSVRSDAKKAAARERIREQLEKFGPPRKPKPIEEFPCTCGKEPHLSTCPRGRAIKRREAKEQGK